MLLNSRIIKDKAFSLGCDLCGIASINRFNNLPDSTNPLHILKNAKSVVVIAKKFLNSTLDSTSTIPYTIVRNYLSREIDEITIQLSYFFEENNYHALPTGAIEPCNYNKDLSKTVGLISLKYAAFKAGLGIIGKNTLLITPEYGNMVWLGAIITSAELESDPIQEKSPCKDNCRICIDNCPTGAIDGSQFMDQQKCWNFAFGAEEGGEWRIKCFKCRETCPYAKGYK